MSGTTATAATIDRVRAADGAVNAARWAIMDTVTPVHHELFASLLHHLDRSEAEHAEAAAAVEAVRDAAVAAGRSYDDPAWEEARWAETGTSRTAYEVWEVTRAALLSLHVPQQHAIDILNRYTEAREEALIAREDAARTGKEVQR